MVKHAKGALKPMTVFATIFVHLTIKHVFVSSVC